MNLELRCPAKHLLFSRTAPSQELRTRLDVPFSRVAWTVNASGVREPHPDSHRVSKHGNHLVRSHSEKLAALPATATTIFFLKTSDERCPFQSSECTAVFRVIEDASEFRRHDKDKQYCYSQQLQAHSGACYVQR
jgi:hypothetical protein